MKSAIVIVAAMLSACYVPVPEPSRSRNMNELTPEQREQTRQSIYLAMITEESCYMKSLDYAVRDKDFQERVLQRLLAGKTLDQVILSDSHFDSRGGTYEVARMLREAPTAYAKELRTADGLVRLEKLIADRFAHPMVEMRQGVVIVNYGHVAARLRAGDRDRIEIDFSNSPHLDENREWRAEEIAAVIKYQREVHPAADGIRVKVLIPGSPKGPEWTYEYSRESDRITSDVCGLDSPCYSHP
jgi:hypothetical protein